MLLDISSARLMIVFILIPAAGNISNNVTTGPSFTLTTSILILKSSKTFSNNSELAYFFHRLHFSKNNYLILRFQ